MVIIINLILNVFSATIDPMHLLTTTIVNDSNFLIVNYTRWPTWKKAFAFLTRKQEQRINALNLNFDLLSSIIQAETDLLNALSSYYGPRIHFLVRSPKLIIGPPNMSKCAGLITYETLQTIRASNNDINVVECNPNTYFIHHKNMTSNYYYNQLFYERNIIKLATPQVSDQHLFYLQNLDYYSDFFPQTDVSGIIYNEHINFDRLLDENIKKSVVEYIMKIFYPANRKIYFKVGNSNETVMIVDFHGLNLTLYVGTSVFLIIQDVFYEILILETCLDGSFIIPPELQYTQSSGNNIYTGDFIFNSDFVLSTQQQQQLSMQDRILNEQQTILRNQQQQQEIIATEQQKIIAKEQKEIIAKEKKEIIPTEQKEIIAKEQKGIIAKEKIKEGQEQQNVTNNESNIQNSIEPSDITPSMICELQDIVVENSSEPLATNQIDIINSPSEILFNDQEIGNSHTKPDNSISSTDISNDTLKIKTMSSATPIEEFINPVDSSEKKILSASFSDIVKSNPIKKKLPQPQNTDIDEQKKSKKCEKSFPITNTGPPISNTLINTDLIKETELPHPSENPAIQNEEDISLKKLNSKKLDLSVRPKIKHSRKLKNPIYFTSETTYIRKSNRDVLLSTDETASTDNFLDEEPTHTSSSEDSLNFHMDQLKINEKAESKKKPINVKKQKSVSCKKYRKKTRIKKKKRRVSQKGQAKNVDNLPLAELSEKIDDESSQTNKPEKIDDESSQTNKPEKIDDEKLLQAESNLSDSNERSKKLILELLRKSQEKNYNHVNQKLFLLHKKLEAIKYNKDEIDSLEILPQQIIWFYILFKGCARICSATNEYLAIKSENVEIEQLQDYSKIHFECEHKLNSIDFLVVSHNNVCKHAIIINDKGLQQINEELAKRHDENVSKYSIYKYNISQTENYYLCVHEKIVVDFNSEYASFFGIKIQHFNFKKVTNPEILYHNPKNYCFFLQQDIERFPLCQIKKYELLDITESQGNTLVWPILQDLFGLPIRKYGYNRRIIDGHVFMSNGNGVYFPKTSLLVLNYALNIFEVRMLRIYY